MCFVNGVAQKKDTSIPVYFKLQFNDLAVVKGQEFTSSKGDTLSIEKFRCYISNVKLVYEDKTISEDKDTFHLLDLDSLQSLSFLLPKKQNKTISKITFNVGIDSLTNASGIQTGVLDPMNGMYWAWQSGYINMKIEGKSPSCITRNNKFQFHIGGYLFPNYALREIEIPINKSQNPNEITIQIDLAKFFSEINLKDENQVMIPGKKAMQLADLSLKMFELE